MQYKSFTNNSIVITGASQGIGRELALQLAKQGALLTLAARNIDQLNQVVGLCQQNGGKAIAIMTDIAHESQCQALIKRAVDEYGRIDILVNNAGIGFSSRFDCLKNLSPGEMVMQINFWGSIFCTYHALEYLKQTRGRIIVINSGFGTFPAPSSSFYSASKYALVGFFDALRLEIENSGVTITMIYPEWVATGVSSRALDSDGNLTGNINPHEIGAMPVGICVKAILKAAEKRKREVLMTVKLKIGKILGSIFPNITDKIARISFK